MEKRSSRSKGDGEVRYFREAVWKDLETDGDKTEDHFCQKGHRDETTPCSSSLFSSRFLLSKSNRRRPLYPQRCRPHPHRQINTAGIEELETPAASSTPPFLPFPLSSLHSLAAPATAQIFPISELEMANIADMIQEIQGRHADATNLSNTIHGRVETIRLRSLATNNEFEIARLRVRCTGLFTRILWLESFQYLLEDLEDNLHTLQLVLDVSHFAQGLMQLFNNVLEELNAFFANVGLGPDQANQVHTGLQDVLNNINQSLHAFGVPFNTGFGLQFGEDDVAAVDSVLGPA
ncbi:unnamed protein product [Lactuca virosa]|uniref:Uncharacterized protein n=1 Tax=Lactuca virosa TaxID=75947 RepID=A0AAU9P8U3_9ASTR|nr:unnamed protein product [Lactuca virosa]